MTYFMTNPNRWIALLLATVALACAALLPGGAQAAPAAQGQLVEQEIRYQPADAGEVVLVWGVDGWAALPEEQRPAGTQIKDALMYTPMQPDGGDFVVRVRVAAGARIDYVFQITRTSAGAATEAWDTNDKKDYHTVAKGEPALVRAVPADSAGGIGPAVWGGLLALLASAVAGVVALRRRAMLAQSYQAIPLGAESAAGPAARAPALAVPEPAERWLARLGVLPLALIVVLGAALRLQAIDQPFTDAFSWRQTSVAMMADNYYRTSWNILFPEVNWYGPGPGYQGREFQTVSYSAALLYLVLGQHDWIGRSIAMIFGLWGIVALYLLVRRVWGQAHALAAAGVMAVLPGAVIVERSFLPDPAMVALVTTTAWLFVAYLQTERARYLALAALVGAWGFCTKVPGLIVGLPLLYATFALLGRRAFAPRRLLAFALFALAALVPVVAYYQWARYLANSYPPYHFAGDGNWVWHAGPGRWLAQGYFVARLRQHFLGWIWTWPVLLMVVGGLLIRPPMAQPAEGEVRRPRWIFHVWLLAGLIYYAIGAQELVENPWNFHILSPAAAALAGHAIVSLAALLARRTHPLAMAGLPAAALALVVLIGQPALAPWYKAYSAESHALGLALSQLSQPGELVVTVGHDYGDPVPIYYSGRRGWGFPPADLSYAWNELPEDDQAARAMLDDLRAKGADWLGIVGEHRDEIWQEHPELAAHIERTCELQADTDEYLIYRIRTPDELAQQP